MGVVGEALKGELLLVAVCLSNCVVLEYLQVEEGIVDMQLSLKFELKLLEGPSQKMSRKREVDLFGSHR